MFITNASVFRSFRTINRLKRTRFSTKHKDVNDIKIEKQRNVDLKCFSTKTIRNFCVIAHIDHGKSTLSDRMLELTQTVPKEDNIKQYLDKLEVEKERGITVKAQTCSMLWTHDGIQYLLNLIDTPGHVDFSYEVWRSIAACEGALLLVDANSGVEAQTIAHFNHALLSELNIIPVLNKIDLKKADPDSVALQLNKLFDIDSKDILKVSAKLGTGVEQLLNAIVERIPPPKGDPNSPLKALVFDLWHLRYRGIILLVRIMDGTVSVGQNISLSSNNSKTYWVKNIGFLHPEEVSINSLSAGQVGLIEANIQDSNDVNVGDILFSGDSPPEEGSIQVPKIQQPVSMVFASIYPCEISAYNELAKAMDKLLLNDKAVDIIKETHPALGNGFRLGFLGLLHMEVFCQRLDDEFNAQVVITAPSVPYKVGDKNIKLYGTEELVVTNAGKLPNILIISEYYEPMVIGTVVTPDQYMTDVNNICMNRRAVQINSYYIDNSRLLMQFRFPLSEIIIDFYDELKSVTSGYASFDYEDDGYEKTELVKLDILVNEKPVEELSSLVHVKRARQYGRSICEKLKHNIQQQQFKIKIQAAVRGKIVAREDIRAYRKDVTAKLYGGDVTRRKKLLERQAEGKRRLRRIGSVEIDADTFINVFKR